MAKEHSETKVRKEKKDKKDKKEKRSESNGVEKKSKKDKHEKKEVTTMLLDELETETSGAVPLTADGDVTVVGSASTKNNALTTVEDDEEKLQVLEVVPLEALVPFANPLADEKQAKKVIKCVKKGNLISSFQVTLFS